MTSALVTDSHYLENNIKYDVVEKKRVLFRFLGTAFVGGFRFSAVLVEVYLKMRFGTSRNAVMQLPNPKKYVLAKEKGGYGFSTKELFGWLLLCPFSREQI